MRNCNSSKYFRIKFNKRSESPFKRDSHFLWKNIHFYFIKKHVENKELISNELQRMISWHPHLPLKSWNRVDETHKMPLYLKSSGMIRQILIFTNCFKRLLSHETKRRLLKWEEAIVGKKSIYLSNGVLQCKTSLWFLVFP